jgi:hypothetical protein
MSQVISIPKKSSINADDEILLVSGHKENAVPFSRLTELSQVSLLKSYCAHFTLYDGHFVSVYIKTAFSKPKKYWIDLAYLEPTPRRVFKIDRPFFYTTGIISLIAAVFMLINAFLDVPWQLLPVNIALICGALISFLILVYRSKDRVIFFSRYGRINWLEFLINKPNRRAYKEFIEKLVSVSHAVSSHQSPRHEQRLGAELHEHRRLRDEGILPPKVYEDVKKRFLGQHGYLKDVYQERYDHQKTQTEINSSNLKYGSSQAWSSITHWVARLGANVKNRALSSGSKNVAEKSPDMAT